MKRAILLSSFLMVYIFLGCKKDGAPEIVNQSKKKALFPLFQKIDAAHSNIHFANNLKADVNTNFNLFNFDYFYNGAGVGVQDLNNDGLPDLFFCGNQSNNKLYLNKGNFVFEDITASSGINSDKNWANGVTFVDVNRDGYHDIYISQGGPHSRNQRENVLLINQGDLTFKNEAAQWGLNDTAISTQSVFFDYDNDGFNDLVIGNRLLPGNYPKAAPSLIYKNLKGQNLEAVTHAVAPLWHSFGMVNKVVAADINQDGWTDFLAAAEWEAPGIFLNQQGKFIEISNRSGLDAETGWWYSIGQTDINKDGLPDFLLGNVGLNIKFKVTKDKPLHVFAGDFDANGSHDVVLSKKYHDKNVPVRGRECSSQHMPFIKEKFPTYMEFATASLEDIYGTKLNEAYQREAVNFESVLLINKGDGVFKLYNLPPEAQSFPVLDMAFYDLNNDGIEDAILSGNIYNTEVETPRLDGGGGLVLLAQNQNYQSVSPHKAGLFFDGNIKSLELVKFANKDIMLAGCNDGPLQSALIKTHKKQRLD